MDRAAVMQAISNGSPELSNGQGRHPDSAKILIYILGIVLHRSSRAYRLHRHQRIPLPAASAIPDWTFSDHQPARTGRRRRQLERCICPGKIGAAGRRSLSGHVDHASDSPFRARSSANVVRFARWKTNSDYLRECQSHRCGSSNASRNHRSLRTRRLCARRFRPRAGRTAW